MNFLSGDGVITAVLEGGQTYIFFFDLCLLVSGSLLGAWLGCGPSQSCRGLSAVAASYVPAVVAGSAAGANFQVTDLLRPAGESLSVTECKSMVHLQVVQKWDVHHNQLIQFSSVQLQYLNELFRSSSLCNTNIASNNRPPAQAKKVNKSSGNLPLVPVLTSKRPRCNQAPVKNVDCRVVCTDVGSQAPVYNTENSGYLSGLHIFLQWA